MLLQNILHHSLFFSLVQWCFFLQGLPGAPGPPGDAGIIGHGVCMYAGVDYISRLGIKVMEIDF